MHEKSQLYRIIIRVFVLDMFLYLFALMIIVLGGVFRIAWSDDSRRSRKNWLCTETLENPDSWISMGKTVPGTNQVGDLVSKLRSLKSQICEWKTVRNECNQMKR